MALEKESMMNLRTMLFFCLGVALAAIPCAAQEKMDFSNNWGATGFNVVSESPSGMEIVFSVPHIQFSDVQVGRDMMKKVSLPGAILGNDEGAPDLPGIGRYFAFPQGAEVVVEIVDSRTQVIENIDLSPAPVIPLVSDDSPPKFAKNMAIYNQDAVYPARPVVHSAPKQMRGVDVMLINITPFGYNPVQKELTVYTDLRVKVSFVGGNGRFGDPAYRSHWFEPMLSAHLLNYNTLPEINFNQPAPNRSTEECEYMIFVPNNPDFIAWAEVIREFRQKQGISTNIFNIADYGGTANGIEAKINDAYNNWLVTKPVAILMMGDAPHMPAKTYSGYTTYVSDNIYADTNGDHLPELCSARLCANNASELELLINKFINFEMSPPTSASFYNEPVIAGGWQSDRWFIICADIVHGFHNHAMGKNPIREYAGYGSGAPSSWSSNPNTYMLIDYFGPSGLGYIPTTPSHLTDWGANATRINADINSGAFYLLHRDHGSETGWGEPHYSASNLSGLNNDDLCFIMSINCLTGKYNYNPECFAETAHRMEHGALGLIAASEISFSFVNDTFIFGVHDSMWENFDPGYGPATLGDHPLMPGFAHASGKHYLEASNWPYNPSNKVDTHNLFHLHGDAFMQLHDQIPQNLVVSHAATIDNTAASFDVTADAGALIGLYTDGRVLGSAVSNGGVTTVQIVPPENPGMMTVTVTKANHYRYEGEVLIETGGALAMWAPFGFPDTRLPGPSDEVTVKILDGVETYVPGSGLLYYRFDSSAPFETMNIVDQGDNLYSADLLGCGPHGTPEFYFSAEGSLGSTVFVPADAPSTVYSMTMDPLFEILLTDDCETNTGWTVQNVNIQTGAWELGNPVGTSAQPEDDNSPDGVNCWVTGRLGGSTGDYDVDGGPTRLTSPVMDLSSGDAEMSFYYYHYHSDYGAQQPLAIEITNNGVAWNTIANVGHTPSWTKMSFMVSDHVTPTANVQIRLSASDNPNDDIVEALFDDLTVMRTNYDATLWASAYEVSCAAGADITFSLGADAGNAGRKYLLLGTFSGTAPGYPLPGGLMLPLNWDVFTDFIMATLNSPVSADFLGFLDANGEASANMNSMGALPSSLIGSTAHFAYTLSSPFDFVSNPIAVPFEP